MTPPIHDVLVVGELNVDLILKGDVTPRFGQGEVLLDDMALCAGGSASIFAAGAARMGLSVRYVSRVGDDLFGHYMVDQLRQAGVDTDDVMIDSSLKTGATIVLSRGQDRAMLTYLGAMATIGPEDVQPDMFGAARHLHVASPFLLTRLRPVMSDMMRMAHERGMTVSLDTNWDPSERWAVLDLLDHVDVLFPNEAELLAITGQPDSEQALASLVGKLRVVAVKRGAMGAMVATGDQRIGVPAYEVPVVDTTGAGDSFDAGFLAGWLGGETIEHSLLLALACGGLTTTELGGFNGQPTREMAESLIRRASWLV